MSMVSPARFLVPGTLLFLGVLGLLAGARDSLSQAQAQVKPESTVQRRTLWVVDEHYAGEPLEVKVGDVIQFVPFKTPLVPKFLDSELKLKLSGEVTLDPIGSLVTDGNDGKQQHSYFVLVRGAGRSNVELRLLNADKDPMPDYKFELKVFSE